MVVRGEHVLAGEEQGVGQRDVREQLVLLGLEVQHLNLPSSDGKEKDFNLTKPGES